MNSESDRMDRLETVMAAFAKVLGASPFEARTLAAALAAGPDRPVNERDALAKVRRAVLVKGSEDDADRAILATWLAQRENNIALDRLPCAGPASSGLPMPAQDLDAPILRDIAGAVGMSSRPRTGRPLRSDT